MRKGESKRERRLQKKLEKIAKQKEKSVRLSSSVEIQNKHIRSTQVPSLNKLPRSPEPSNYKNYCFQWCSFHSDIEGSWEWGEERLWSDDEYSDTIKPHLDGLNNNHWADVERQTYNGKGGFRKSLNKYQSLETICDEAQIRWLDLDLVSQFEELFRFRLGSNKRIWGVRVQHCFFIVWYERYHEICPIK